MAPKPQELPSKATNTNEAPSLDDRVVISGVAGLFPACHHVKDLSNILYQKINPVNENTRWEYNHPEVARFTGNVPGLPYFDGQFFKVHYRLGNNMDSMARKILEQTYAAIYDAGVSPGQLSGKKVGVYLGTCFSETEKACFYVASSRSGLGIAGCNKSMFANRISYWLNAKGPSMSIDDACCSSTVALESAYQAIVRGECESAIVGGANICLHPQSSIHFGRIMKMSMDGKTRSFDSNASGCVRSEAICVLFLQKAKDALRVYADVVHVKTAFTSLEKGEMGPKYGFYRNPSDVVTFLKKFYEEAKVDPRAVQYVEAFGSAIPEADKSELEVIDEIFCKNRKNKLFVGSVTSNIGYGEAASGLNAITKVLLGYQNGRIAANINCDSPRQDVAAIREGRIKIVTEHEHFDSGYASINGLAITGINSHVLLNGHYKPKDPTRYKSSIPYLVLVSARQDSAVSVILDDLKTRAIDPEELALFHNIHETRISGHLGRGFTILDTSKENKTVSLFEVVNYFDEAQRPLWFVYSGMGSQWAGMGTHLMRIPIFAAAIERCRKVLEPKGIDIVHIITSPDQTIFNNILHSFVGIAAVQIGLTDVLRELGIIPDKIIGHSVGELGCAYADGCFTAEEMILSAYSRGLVSLETPFIKGSMAAIGLGFQEISKICPPEIEVACHNSPDSCTISGPAEIMKEFVASLVKKNIFAKEVPCSNIAYHSRYIAEAGPALLKYLSQVIKSPKLRSDRWVSTSIPQERWNENLAKYSSAEYHTNNLLNSVLFEETSKLIPSNALVVEIAPHGLLQAILKRSLPESCRNVSLTRRGHPDNARFLLEAIGKLYMEGCMPKVKALYPKIEFPVSTGTPMLSHLVQWAHNEKWHVPLYVTANRKTAAACKYVISIHDDEHKYLSGHIIKGKNQYPVAATLVSVWDTLAMSLGVELKKLSVQFREVHLLSQPILHDQRPLRLSVTLQRCTGRFEVMDDIVLIAKGYIFGKISPVALDTSSSKAETESLNSDEIYQLLSLRDYGYEGAFRSIFSTNFTQTDAKIIWQNNWVTLIDGMLQLNTLRKTYATVTQPNYIKRITIDVDKHESTVTHTINNLVVMNANIIDLHDCTSCGGVLMHNIQFLQLPSVNEDFLMRSLQFVPFFSPNNFIKESTSLSIFLQIIAENLNKSILNVLEIRNDLNNGRINYTLNDVSGLQVNYLQTCRDSILQECSNFLTDIDCVILNNLSNDEIMCQALYRILKRNIFIINKEKHVKNVTNTRPTILYRIISIHNFDSTRQELVLWRPTTSNIPSSVLTVRTSSDLKLLASMLASAQHKLTVLAHHTVPGLKSMIMKHRNKFNSKINLILLKHEISEEQYLNEIPSTDLAFTILDHGIWGGEYYVPLEEKSNSDAGVILKTGRIADLDSLHWIETPEDTGPGLNVKVHYTGVNTVSANGQMGISKLNKRYNQSCMVIDFSGTTKSGVRVMGVTQTEGIASSLKANPDLLWPVPATWSLEDAATVPLAYSMAFYILCIKSQLYPGFRILVHGGTGALGQAIISIALAYGCEVFATVSSVNKKRFLKRLFPELKDDHIGHSRDVSFSDMVFIATKGKRCNMVITCSKEELRNISLKCCGSLGIIFDTGLLHNREDYQFGMHSLTIERSYVPIDISTVFKPEYEKEMKRIQVLLSEGIARGYVRPLTRVVFEAQNVHRAFRLIANSSNRGRVLLDLHQADLRVLPRFSCSPQSCQVLVSDNNLLGIKLAEKLISLGAKNLNLHLPNKSNLLLFKSKLWQQQGVSVEIFTLNISDEKNIVNVLTSGNLCALIESILVAVTKPLNEDVMKFLKSCSAELQNLGAMFKCFAVIRSDDHVEDLLIEPKIGQRFNYIHLPPISKISQKDGSKSISINSAVDILERALRVDQPVVTVQRAAAVRNSLLQEIAAIADVSLPPETPLNVTLKQLHMDKSKTTPINAYLRNVHNICLPEDHILSLTLEEITKLENYIREKKFKDTKGLKTFFSHIDPDELLATTEMVFLPTLTSSSSMRDDEFDVNQTYLCIVPGLEGFYSRFRDLCERLKLPAIVLQPGLNNPHETIRDLAQRYANILLSKTELKNKFYLLGYECGIFVALEIAAILEEKGLTGTVYCLGGSPYLIKTILDDNLSEFGTDAALQLAVTKHMYSLMVDDDAEKLDSVLRSGNTLNDRVKACVQMVSGRLPYSNQYASEMIQAAYFRILQVRQYHPQPRKLRSLLVCLSPRNSFDTKSLSSSLSQFSEQPLISYQLETPLAFVAQDLRCAAIVNRHLDSEVIDLFNKRNHCETYLLNSDTFMTTDITDTY